LIDKQKIIEPQHVAKAVGDGEAFPEQEHNPQSKRSIGRFLFMIDSMGSQEFSLHT
jgi:hypothetical protein